jgi:HD-GYP domain-containing protein (c-di-GMP phosphodiesterase class II)
MRGVAVAAASACTEGGTMTMKGESLPERLASTAAAYESLVTRTPYRPQLSESEALQELRSGAGCDLDKRLWAAFEEVLARPRA